MDCINHPGSAAVDDPRTDAGPALCRDCLTTYGPALVHEFRAALTATTVTTETPEDR